MTPAGLWLPLRILPDAEWATRAVFFGLSIPYSP